MLAPPWALALGLGLGEEGAEGLVLLVLEQVRVVPLPAAAWPGVVGAEGEVQSCHLGRKRTLRH